MIELLKLLWAQARRLLNSGRLSLRVLLSERALVSSEGRRSSDELIEDHPESIDRDRVVAELCLKELLWSRIGELLYVSRLKLS